MLKKILMVPDTHVPYQGKKAFALMLKAAKYFKPDIIIILGDFADCYSVSSHSKAPGRSKDLQWELDQVITHLEMLNALKASQKVYVAGNHEDRLDRYLQEKAPELFNYMRLEKILKLKELGWKYIPYKSHYTLGRLFLTHDTGTAGKYAHYKAQDDFQGNVVIGHTHRMGYAIIGNAKGKAHVCAQLGWLGDVDQIDYMHKVKAQKDWAHGFGLGYMEANGNVHVQPVPIIDGKVVVEGRLIR